MSLKSTMVWKGKVNELRTTRRIYRRGRGGVPSVNTGRVRRDGEDGRIGVRVKLISRERSSPGTQRNLQGRSADIRLWRWEGINFRGDSQYERNPGSSLTDGCAARYAGRVRMKTTNSVGVCKIL